MYDMHRNPSTPQNDAEDRTYVVKSGAAGPRPMWWEVCLPTTRDVALGIMDHLAELTPDSFGPFGNRRLMVVQKRAVTS
jgi:hypothetical protein